MKAITIYIVQGNGVRQGTDLRFCRHKDGRLVRWVKILKHKGDDATAGKPRWVDAALIYRSEEEAQAARSWARTHQARHGFCQTITTVLINADYIASLR